MHRVERGTNHQPVQRPILAEYVGPGTLPSPIDNQCDPRIRLWPSNNRSYDGLLCCNSNGITDSANRFRQRAIDEQWCPEFEAMALSSRQIGRSLVYMAFPSYRDPNVRSMISLERGDEVFAMPLRSETQIRGMRAISLSLVHEHDDGIHGLHDGFLLPVDGMQRYSRTTNLLYERLCREAGSRLEFHFPARVIEQGPGESSRVMVRQCTRKLQELLDFRE